MLSKKFTIKPIPYVKSIPICQGRLLLILCVNYPFPTPSHGTERFYVINFSIAKVNTNFPLLSLTFHQNLEYGYCYNAFFKPFNAFYFRSDCNKNADEQVLWNNEKYQTNVTGGTRSIHTTPSKAELGRGGRNFLGSRPQKRPDCPQGDLGSWCSQCFININFHIIFSKHPIVTQNCTYSQYK